MIERRRNKLPAIITAIIVVGILVLWIFTARDARQILGRGDSEGQHDRGVVYASGDTD